MLKGHIFSKQLYSNNIAALANSIFANGTNGIYKNFKNSMDVTYSGHEVTIDSGACLIQGRPIEEDSSTTLDAGIETAFCILVVEIDLSLTNTNDDFEQGYYNIVKSASAYPELTQEDIIGDTGKYQFELARFKISDGMIVDFEDNRAFLEDELEAVLDLKISEIINSGSNSNGNYIKFADGTMICYGKTNISFALNIAYGSAYRSDVQTINLPQIFIDTNYTYQLQANAPAHLCYGVGQNTGSIDFIAMGFISQEAGGRTINYVAIGKWK